MGRRAHPATKHQLRGAAVPRHVQHASHGGAERHASEVAVAHVRSVYSGSDNGMHAKTLSVQRIDVPNLCVKPSQNARPLASGS